MLMAVTECTNQIAGLLVTQRNLMASDTLQLEMRYIVHELSERILV